MLHREAEVALLHLQLGLADHVELHRLNAERLRLPPRSLILRRIALGDAHLAVAG